MAIGIIPKTINVMPTVMFFFWFSYKRDHKAYYVNCHRDKSTAQKKPIFPREACIT
jgi:hypothetical protein